MKKNVMPVATFDAGTTEWQLALLMDRDPNIRWWVRIYTNGQAFIRTTDGFYFPDFMVRTADAVYLVETKAQQQTNHPNVQRKRKAAVGWCDRINTLEPAQRQNLPWHYVLLGEDAVAEWQDKGAHLAQLLDFARLRPVPMAALQGRLLD